ncbi:MAG TPA: GxxExxY protein [Longimicrobiaceae bacterium]|nr:GxxExxY protein [Longimicrobiaceae bacterium]
MTTERRSELELGRITGEIVDAAIKVHMALGPGLLESAYEACMCVELRRRGLRLRQQLKMPVLYEGLRIDIGYRIDLLVEESVVIEMKAVKRLLPVHEAQLLSYLRLSDRKVGLLLNFHAPLMRDGIKRMVNGL